MAIDLHITVARGDDNRLNGTVRAADTVRAFSGTLELLSVFEDLLAATTPAAPLPVHQDAEGPDEH